MIKSFDYGVFVIGNWLDVMLVIILMAQLGLSHMLFMIFVVAICISKVAHERLLTLHFVMRSIMVGRASLMLRDFLVGVYGMDDFVLRHITTELIMM